MKYYVTADIHGFYTPFHKALTASGYFDETGEKKLIICGDLFDRGTEERELQQFIMENKEDLILIQGNHEELFCELVGRDHGFAYYHHVHNGTYQTALALTGYDATMARIRHYDFAEAARKTPYYAEIIPSMLDYYETAHYIFIHGWIPCFAHPKYSKMDDWRTASPEDWERARWFNGMDAAKAGVLEEGKTIV